ncbi:CaiB/BaiF CoA-transferase family protein [Rhodococcus sp. ACPA1]|uniref:CaiB/BaiF CoA transferase family protein n=1 Tax=Rhodococcus sp. ACPA1 TaxID=2028572 RepID=UPI000BB15726|nr:CaiB/BaiF CoA-transferase family protein [Rhodococcus sp. ACPA1]PBC54992.1 carnitine dehydratase [Rhodococcus sp. ACPA1]RZI91079.1 MAG: CoA transferase [Microbacterium sp.]
MSGPLTGVRIVELAGIGPGPFCGMLFADLGAEVIRVERVGAPHDTWNVAARGRRSIAVDLKAPGGAEAVLKLVATADGLIEGFRPGVTERLGLGPDHCHVVNPRLVYGRMTGWGQSGPLAQAAGHDIDYIAIAGALHGTGEPGRPPRPAQNFVGDYGGGAMFLAFGMVSAILHAREMGEGQVVDAAMTDGTALLTAVCHGRLTTGAWFDRRGGNIVDGSAPFYGTYECADGEYFAFGAIEPQFTDEMLNLLGLDHDEDLKARWHDRSAWPELRERVAAIVRTRSRDDWESIFDGSDACAAPVLSLTEATKHPHNVARGTFVDIDGIVQPAPAPRFSRTPGEIRGGIAPPGRDSADLLAEVGYSPEEIDSLTHSKVIA